MLTAALNKDLRHIKHGFFHAMDLFINGIKHIPSTVKSLMFGKVLLWELFWVWYVLLNSTALVAGYVFLKLTFGIPFVGLIGSFFGFCMAFIYPIVFSISLWSCAYNIKDKQLKPFGYLARLSILPFWLLHYILGSAYFYGALLMFIGSLSL